jgi:hypothetical protein
MNQFDLFRINSSKIVHETIDGEVIIINFENGSYYSLNAAGKDIWNCLEKNFNLSRITVEITARYKGNNEEIKKDLNQFLVELEKEELIILDKEMKDNGPEISPNKLEINEEREKLKYEKPELRKYTDMKEMLLLDPIHEVDETGWPSAKISPKKVL